jgi:hypothetical protein
MTLWLCGTSAACAGETIGLGYFYQVPMTGITGKAGLFINVALFCSIVLSLAIFPVHVYECKYHDSSYRYVNPKIAA